MDYQEQQDDGVVLPHLEPTNDIDMNFGLLPEAEGRSKAFLTSALSNVAIFGIILLLTIAALKHKQIENLVTTPLVLPPEKAPPPPKPKPPPPPKMPPTPVVEKPLPPKIEKIEPPKPVIAEMPKPVMPSIPSAPPKAVPPPPPPPKVGLFQSNAAPTVQANNNKPPTVKTGGFGDPLGAKPNPNAKAGVATMAAVGAFDMPKGEGTGAGRAGKGVVQGTGMDTGVVGGVKGGSGRGPAVVGVMNGVVGGVPGGTGTGHGTVKSGGFGSTVGTPGPKAVPQNNEPQTTPIEVLYKPDVKQFYSAEARNMHIEGEVVLRIKVDANGHGEFISVVRSLGHGLDEAAVRVLSQMRFKPAYSNGQPVEKVTNVTITFQLA
jgi:TonB family protein